VIVNKAEKIMSIQSTCRDQMRNLKLRKHTKVQAGCSGDSCKEIVSAGEQSLASPIEDGGDA
jgi:hypothetical protein